jgi:hypothetical protein
MNQQNKLLQFKNNFMYTYTYFKTSPLTNKEYFFFTFGLIVLTINLYFKHAYPLIHAAGNFLMAIGIFLLAKRAIFQEIIPKTQVYYSEYYLSELQKLKTNNQNQLIFRISAFLAYFLKVFPILIIIVFLLIMYIYFIVESIYYYNFNYTMSQELWRAKVGIQSYEDAWRHITNPWKYIHSSEIPIVQDLKIEYNTKLAKIAAIDAEIAAKDAEIAAKDAIIEELLKAQKKN